MTAITHIGRMLEQRKGPGITAAQKSDGVETVIHYDEHGRSCGQAWAVRHDGKLIGMHFGDADEAQGMLCLLQGREVPRDVASRIRDRKARMAAMFAGGA